MKRTPITVASAVLPGALAAIAPPAIAGMCGWVLVLVAPGLALARPTGLGPGAVPRLLAVTALSPIAIAVLSGALLMLGASPDQIAHALFGIGAICVLFAIRPANPGRNIRGGQSVPVAASPRDYTLWILLSFTALLVVLTGLLPQISTAWRSRSDAWFHAAVVLEIRHSGVPPTDPYFAGIALQYMWLYHALVLAVAATTHLDAFRSMALLNVYALVALILSVFETSLCLSRSRNRALGSALMVPLGMSALFWLALPLRAARALTGEVRGIAELSRQFQILPLDFGRAGRFVSVFFNPEFFLDKFMVATAFSLALAAFALAWLALAKAYHRRGISSAVLMFSAVVGALAFHPVVGCAAIAMAVGAATLSLVVPRFRTRLHVRTVLAPAIAALAAVVAMAPYLAPLFLHRDAATTSPLAVTPHKLIGMLIACAAVLALAYGKRRELFASDDPAVKGFLAGSVAVITVSIVMNLPGSNALDKPPYFAYYPIALIAGWTFADWWRGPRRHPAAVVAVVVLLWLPINGLEIAAAWFGKTPTVAVAGDTELSRKVRKQTPDNAVFIAADNDVVLLVDGPRRYLFGRRAYAYQWGYDADTMARRCHATSQIVRGQDPDACTLGVIARFDAPLFALLRGSDARSRLDSLVRFAPGVFHQAFLWTGGIVVAIDHDAAARLLPAAAPSPPLSQLRRELGY